MGNHSIKHLQNNNNEEDLVQALKKAIIKDQLQVEAMRKEFQGNCKRKKRTAIKHARSLQMRMCRNRQQLENFHYYRTESIQALPDYQQVVLSILSSPRVLLHTRKNNNMGISTLPSELIRELGEMLFAKSITIYVRNFFNDEVSCFWRSHPFREEARELTMFLVYVNIVGSQNHCYFEKNTGAAWIYSLSTISSPRKDGGNRRYGNTSWINARWYSWKRVFNKFRLRSLSAFSLYLARCFLKPVESSTEPWIEMEQFVINHL